MMLDGENLQNTKFPFMTISLRKVLLQLIRESMPQQRVGVSNKTFSAHVASEIPRMGITLIELT